MDVILNAEATLPDLINELRQALDGYHVRLERWLADLALYSYALDVLEHAMAVDQLRVSQVPRAAYANARAAMESAQDMLLLVADPDNYDLNGCYARAAEVIEIEGLYRRKREGDRAIGSKDPLEVSYGEDSLLADAKAWDEEHPGRGKLLRAAFEHVQADSDRQKHWSGMGRKEAAKYLEGTIGGEGYAAVLDALYGVVSYHAHPSMRGGGREIVPLDDGRMALVHREVDERAPDHYSRMALQFALLGLAKRP